MSPAASRRAVVAGAAAVVGLGLAGAGAVAVRRSSGGCGPRLTRADLDAGIALAGRYLVAAQRPAGDFVYEVDWRTGVEGPGANLVRQAGATWGLALLQLDGGDGVAGVAGAVDRSLGYWMSRVASRDGLAWIQGERGGETGMAALVGLALLDRLSAPEPPSTPDGARYEETLEGILRWLVTLRLPAGGFASAYDNSTGAIAAKSKPNPYADGEVLLLLAKAAVERDRADLRELALRYAAEDHERNVAGPLRAEPDPDTTKGYYQWGSMAWSTLAKAGYEADELSRWLVDLAHWMVDVHSTLSRRKNTAYAYEGLISAYDWAAQHGDAETAYKLACVAHQGLRKLSSWQLGHPLALPSLASAAEPYLGGVQNAADESLLRIDVTQHQLHALMLARDARVDEAAL